MKRKQSGVALITIMLVVVIATILGVKIASEQHFAIVRSANIFDDVQARQYAYGGEELARQILREDFVTTPTSDTLAEVWASTELQYEFENGGVDLLIEDLQGRLNVNSLAYGDSFIVTRERFQRLAAELGIEPMFVERLVDWLDENEARELSGAEDFDYLGLERPYRAANRAITDVSELRLLLEMDDETFSQIEPYIAALPDSSAPVNINTANAMVLAAVIPGITAVAAEGFVQNRDAQEGFETVDQFLQDPALAGTGLDRTGLGVQSGFFKVSVRARYHDRYAYLTSVIQRNTADGSMRVIYRDLSKKLFPLIVEQMEGEEGNG